MGYEEALTEARSILATGDYDAAQRAEAVMLAFAESAEDTQEQGKALRTSGVYAGKAGRVSRALCHFQDANELLTEPFERAILFESMAAIVSQAGRKELAKSVYDELYAAMSLCHDAPMAFLPYAHVATTRMLRLMGSIMEAHSEAERAVSLAMETESGRAEAYGVLAFCLEHQGDTEAAMDALENAMRHTKDHRCLMDAHADYSRLALRLGDVKAAGNHLRMALDFPDIRDRLVLAKVHRTIILLVKADPDKAIALLERIVAYLENTPVEMEVTV